MHVQNSAGSPLQGIHVLSLAINLPGPVAAARLQEFGARVTKIEPPGGDPLQLAARKWYEEMVSGQTVESLNLKEKNDLAKLNEHLAETDLLLTSNRPAALKRLGLGWPEVGERHPRLCQVAIVGYPRPNENTPGHDLTYQATAGLIRPPNNPVTLLADMAGAEMAVSAALGLLIGRDHEISVNRYVEVSLSEATAHFARPFTEGLTKKDGLLGGGLPGYRLYRSADGWIALAALEPHFWERILSALGLNEADIETLAKIFREKPSASWEAWADKHDIPLVAVPD